MSKSSFSPSFIAHYTFMFVEHIYIYAMHKTMLFLTPFVTALSLSNSIHFPSLKDELESRTIPGERSRASITSFVKDWITSKGCKSTKNSFKTMLCQHSVSYRILAKALNLYLPWRGCSLLGCFTLSRRTLKQCAHLTSLRLPSRLIYTWWTNMAEVVSVCLFTYFVMQTIERILIKFGVRSSY
jgi:hypothetical protein